MTKIWIGSVAVTMGLMTSVPANSRAVVIDSNSDIQFTACSYSSAPCQAFSTTMAAGSRNAVVAPGTGPINFTLNYGNGPQSNVYVYNNGLISIGNQLNGSVTTINSLAALGQDVLTPAYDSSLQVLQNSFTYSTGIDNGGPFFGQQFLRLNYTVRTGNNSATDTIVQANLYQQGNPGDFILLFAYGTFVNSPNLPSSTLIGYNLAGNLNQTTAGQNQAALADADDDTTFRYTFVGGRLVGGSAVPEPATWLQMMLGFGLIGWGLRRFARTGIGSPAKLVALGLR